MAGVTSGNSDTIKNHAAVIWSVADLLRGDYKQSEYGNVVLPLTVLRRWSLKPAETRAFMDAALSDGAIRASGAAITKILPPVSRVADDGGHAGRKRMVLSKLNEFFDRFFGLGLREASRDARAGS